MKSRPVAIPAVFLICLLLSVGGLSGAEPTYMPPPSDRVPEGPDRAIGQYELGFREYRAGHFREAEGHFQAALAAEPNLLKAHYWLGKIYREKGMLQEALFHWEEVLRLQRLIQDRRTALKFRDNEYPAEEQILAVRERREQAEKSFEKGRRLLAEGHWEGAASELKTAVQLYPANPEYLKLLARLLWDKGNSQGSARIYSDLLETRAVSKEVALEGTDRLAEAGWETAAVSALRDLESRFPGDSAILVRLEHLRRKGPPGTVSMGKVVSKRLGTVVLDFGLDSGLKLADEYNLRLRAFRPGDPIIDSTTGRTLGRAPDRTTAELLVTKVFAESCWALIRREFGSGAKEGDLIEIQGVQR